ncbi:MAG: dihydroorotate dehydrogenase electron transfer subunit [Magnetococcales bacterium]|nr:dihydroorotate dehydrogenase electron transfer subunit [Magnetococcales bacterium]MBF0347897.1 dihydroorotate dehydrogenase electron transfer subunit [Magnetococcales bacterium]MBF0629404.1 dihydroorotate dehydrogenase electron transfer subunit [Magnetococcales bacterium]
MSTRPNPPRRIRVRVHENRPLGGRMHGLTLDAPAIARQARPGQFLQMDCHPSLTLPRPFSIMNTDPETGMVEVFYKVVGVGTGYMEQWRPGDQPWVLGPLGSSFTEPPEGCRAVLVAGGVGLAPLRFWADRLRQRGIGVTLLWGLEAETVPFATVPARIGLPGGVIESPLALAREEQRGIVTRLASITKKPGFFHGWVSDLLHQVLEGTRGADGPVHLYVCGPTAMMVAVTELAKQWKLKGEISLEGTMACGFGGCAGCAVPVYHGDDWRFVRSCTEGPVLPLDQILWHIPEVNTNSCNKEGERRSCL